MDIHAVYEVYDIGSNGFVAAIVTYCGYGISPAEIERIAEEAETGAEFEEILRHEYWWMDEGRKTEPNRWPNK